MSDLAIALTTGGFTLAAGALGILGAGYLQRQARKREDRAERERVVSEVVGAADNLLEAVRLFRKVWALRYRTVLAAGIEAGALRPATSGEGNTSAWEILSAGLHHVAAALTADGIVDRMFDRSGAKYLAVVMPPPAQQRLTTAVSPLRISPDKRLADAADKLATAGAGLANNASAARGRVFARAEETFERRAADFRAAGTLQKKRRRDKGRL